MYEENDGKFVKGLLCGVLLTLICMGLSAGWQRAQMEKRIASRQERQTEDEKQETLELDTVRIRGKIEAIEELIDENYLTAADAGEVEDAIYYGMLAGLEDPYSQYLTPKELESLNESTNGEYSGIGVSLQEDQTTGEITVVSCFAGSPADLAGILAGDLIRSLNGEELADAGINLETLVSMIREDKDNSFLLGVERGGERLEMEVKREHIEIPTVEYELREDGIGYLRILEFDSVTETQFADALDALEKEGMEKLIVDVRDNPGGILQVVCNILDLLLPEGRIVYTEDKYGVQEEYFSDGEHQFTKPLVVLTNENSASASEIFAGAVKDYGIGTLVGATTFGKGLVQRIFPMTDGAGVKLTVAKYFTPKGTDIHEKGIVPDVEVEASEDDGEDRVLEEAVKILQKIQKN